MLQGNNLVCNTAKYMVNQQGEKVCPSCGSDRVDRKEEGHKTEFCKECGESWITSTTY